MQEVDVFDVILTSVCPIHPSNVKDARNKFTIGHFPSGTSSSSPQVTPPKMRSETEEALRLLLQATFYISHLCTLTTPTRIATARTSIV